MITIMPLIFVELLQEGSCFSFALERFKKFDDVSE